MIVLPGLILTMVLAMLDQLVVSTALPRIVGDLGGVSHLSWVVTAYILTSTITTPFYGKLGDMYGRKKLFIFAIVLFLIGSALSGLSTSMAMLISFRALQGLGAGGLMVGAMATLGEIVPPRERGKYMSYFMAAMMLATVGGPLLGGWITDAFSWRWIFYINLPVGGAALVYMWATLKLPVRRVERRIDYLGGVLLGVIATAVILVATWGGTEYSWISAPVLGLIAVAVVAFVWFLSAERRAAEPMLPLHVFKSRNFSLSMALAFFVGLGLFGALTFLPLYQQTVQGATPTVSGLLLTPMMVSSAAISVLAGLVVSKTGKYRLFPIVGGAVMTVAMYLLTGLSVTTSRWQLGIDFVILGLGMGCLMQMVSLIAQNSVELRDMGVATSARMFFQQMGGSLGVAAFGAVFASRLNSVMASAGSAGAGVPRQRRVVRPDPGVVAAARGAGDRVPRGHPRGGRGVPGRAAGLDRGLRALPVHQAGAAARPGAERERARPRGGGAHRLAASAEHRRAIVKRRKTGVRRQAAAGRPFYLACCQAPGVGHGVDDLHRDLLAVGQRVARLLADLLAGDRRAKRGLRRVHVDRRAALLARGQQERDLLVVADEADGHRHAGADHAIRARRLADPGVLQNVLELEDPAFLLALLLLGRVVTAVLAQVSLVAGSLDLFRDIDAPLHREIVELGLKPVVRLLGKPGDAFIARLGHGHSSVLRRAHLAAACWLLLWVRGLTCLPSSQPVSGGNLLRLTRFGHWRELVKCSQ